MSPFIPPAFNLPVRVGIIVKCLKCKKVKIFEGSQEEQEVLQKKADEYICDCGGETMKVIYNSGNLYVRLPKEVVLVSKIKVGDEVITQYDLNQKAVIIKKIYGDGGFLKEVEK